MELDHRHCYTALKARDRRFDGRFFVGVASTGIYCRPVCPARTPAADRCAFFANASLAEAAGFRPCLRCRPELAPGSASVDKVSATAWRIWRRIEAGALNGGGIEPLAAEFDLSSRQLRRVVEAEFGIAPLALAQTQRLLRAKQLLTDTRMPVVDVAFASGFASLRQFNRLFHSRYGLSPTDLRRRGPAAQSDGLLLQLGYRAPLDWKALTGFLVSRGSPAVEQIIAGHYVRVIRLQDSIGWIRCRPAPGRPCIEVEVSPGLMRQLVPLTAQIRQLFDLDADPDQINERLAAGGMAAPIAGLRVPGCVDGFEVALRAVLGQQISVRAATTVFGRFVEAFGLEAETPWPALNRTAPCAQRIADAPEQVIMSMGLSQRRARTVQVLARACVEQGLLSQMDGPGVREELLALPGIGLWTCEYVAMRVLGDPDAFPASDLGVLRGLGVSNPRAALSCAEPWRPWRAYAAFNLWQQSQQGG